MKSPHSSSLTRRGFLRQTGGGLAGGALLSALPISRTAHGAGGGELKIAMVGCGGRATGAANQALHNSGYPNVKLVAVAELFQEQVDKALNVLSTQNPGKVDVPKEHVFLGFDAYKKAIALCDVAILATPCCFRPMMFEEAVRQGKHAFLEKPVAVDAAGVRSVLATVAEAKKKSLKV